MYLTKYGTQWGTLPMTAGRIFWVAPTATYYIDGRAYSASDQNDGLAPENALASVSRALALIKLSKLGQAITTSLGDIIALLPGTHTLTAALAMNQPGVTIMGLPYLPDPRVSRGAGLHQPPAILTMGTAATTIANVTAADCTFLNLTLRPITQGMVADFTTAAHRLTFKDCLLDMKTPVGHANTAGIQATSAVQAPDGVRVLNCTLLEGNGGVSCGFALDLGAAVNFIVGNTVILKDGSVAGAVAWTTAIKVRDNAQGAFIENDFIAGGVAITNGVSGVAHTGANIIQFLRNTVTVSVTNPFTGWAAGDCGLGLNYVATVAGGSGGTLITSTT